MEHNGQTPLMQAVYHLRFETVKVLVKAGAKVDIKDKNGNTALHVLGDKMKRDPGEDTMHWYKTIGRYLLKDGKADPGLRNKKGEIVNESRIFGLIKDTVVWSEGDRVRVRKAWKEYRVGDLGYIEKVNEWGHVKIRF